MSEVSAAFTRALDFVLEIETNRYTNDPKDSGGPTKWGVTLRSWSSYIGRRATPEEIEALTFDQIKPFYFDRYWHPLGCDRIASPVVATALFDCGVLYGVGTTAILAQEVLNDITGAELKLDGVIGDKSIEVFNSVHDGVFIAVFHGRLMKRIDFVVGLNAKNERFRHGWVNRANRLLTLNSGTLLNRGIT